MNRLFSAFIAAAVACGIISRAAAQTTTLTPGGANDLGPPTGPAREVADASNAFAFDLYAKLAADKNHAGKNLFFSPYAITTALDMVAEGARGETAQQMADTLRFPAAWRRAGGDAAALPWDAAPLHDGTKWLTQRFTEQPAPRELTRQIDAARAELAKEIKVAEKLDRDNKYDAYEVQAKKTNALGKKFDDLIAQLPGFELAVANALWAEKTYPFQQAYVDSIKANYAAAGLNPADFFHNAESVRKEINAWIARQTKDKIKDMLAPGTMPNTTRLVLVNAIYFKGKWAEPFKPEQTAPEDFTAADGKLRVDMMNQWAKNASYAAFNADGSLFPTPDRISSETKESACYPDQKGFLAAEIPYKGDGLVMTLLAPRAPDGLPALEKILTADNARGWLGKLAPRTVKIALPRFTFKTSYNLNDPLAALGMPRAFKYPDAQFEAISATKELFIGLVQHDAFVDVNEKGTEAAAATVVSMRAGAAMPGDWPFTPEFRADRPFLFVIRDKLTGVILFVGRVMKPETAQ